MKIGSLCTGYGGLDMAVESVLGGKMVWYSEFEKHPSHLLSVRYPGIPNIGDLTKVNWADLEPVDVLTGGYPCQPFSIAGLRQGENDERHLWPYIREAISVVRPRITILENVGGHLSKGFSSVLRDCAEDGYVVRWDAVRASEIGAPHRRERLFFTITDPAVTRLQGGVLRPRGHVEAGERDVEDRAGGAPAERGEAHALLATPQARYSKGAPKDGFCNGSFPRDVQTLFPTPQATDGSRGIGKEVGGHRQSGNHRQVSLPGVIRDRVPLPAWGKYGPAIQRWEEILGRPAPYPTEPGRGGNPRIDPKFTEWMMGLPEGWVTDPALGLPRISQLKLLGNGVVPQQADLALRLLLDSVREED